MAEATTKNKARWRAIKQEGKYESVSYNREKGNQTYQNSLRYFREHKPYGIGGK